MGPRIGLWGTFDLENYGDMLFPRIARMELVRRLPGTEIRVFAPFGYPGLNRFDDGVEPAEPLGPWSEERASELAAELDCVVIGGGEIVHDRDDFLAPHYGVDEDEMTARAPSRFFIEGLGMDREATLPVIWHTVGVPFDPTPDMAARLRSALAGRAYVTVRDEGSKGRLEAAGVEREVEVVPDPALLLPRLYGPDLLAKRLAFLRRMGWYPAQGGALVVQGSRELIPHVDRLAAALTRLLDEREDLSAVLIETGPIHGDGALADALMEALPPTRAYRIGAPAGLIDVTTAIASSAGFAGSSFHGNVAALTFDRPHVIVNAEKQPKLAGLAELIGEPRCLVEDPAEVDEAFRRTESAGSREKVVEALTERIDAHFDRIVRIAGESAQRLGRRVAVLEEESEPSPDDVELLRTAHDALTRRMGAQQSAFADRVQAMAEGQAELRRQLEEREGELERTREEVVWLRGVVEEKDRRLDALRNSRALRYSAGLRAVYDRLRHPLGRR